MADEAVIRNAVSVVKTNSVPYLHAVFDCYRKGRVVIPADGPADPAAPGVEVGERVATPAVGAQVPTGPALGPALPTAFGPYVNLAYPGALPAINYFGPGRHELEFGVAEQQLQQNQGQQVNPFAAVAARGEVVVTGNPSEFRDYRSYSQNQFSACGFEAAGPGAGESGVRVGGFDEGDPPNPFAQIRPGPKPATDRKR